MLNEKKNKHKVRQIPTSFPNSQSNLFKGIILAFFSLLLLGILPIISNSRPQELDALNFALFLSFWELICATPVFFIELRSTKRGIFIENIDLKIKRKTLLIMLITGIIFSFSTFLYVFSFEKAGTISAAIAIQAYPLFSIVIEWIFLKRKKNAGELIFTFILIIGIYYLGTSGKWIISGFSPWFGVALLVPFLWAIAHVTIKNTLDQSPITPNQVTFLRVLVTTIILFGVGLLINGLNNIFTGFTTFEFQIYAFFMGFLYFLELVNWFYAVKYVDVSVASSITTPSPIVTTILALMFLNEVVEFYQIISMIIVFISLYGLLYFGKRKLVT